MKNIIIIITLFLAGCGFHLRGNIPLSPNLHKLYIETKDPYSGLSRNLEVFLHASGVIITQKPEDATMILEVVSEATSANLLAINGMQNTRVYDLILTVTFQVKDAQGKIWVPPETAIQKRTLTIQFDQILAGSNEANNIYQHMRQGIVYDMINRLSSDNITTLLITADQSK